MPGRVEEAEGVTNDLGTYLGVGVGSLSHRKHDVEHLLRKRVTADTSLDYCPAPEQVDPELWQVLMSSLLQGVEGAPHARSEKACGLVGEILERKRKRDQRIRQDRRRGKKKQVCMCVLCTALGLLNGLFYR